MRNCDTLPEWPSDSLPLLTKINTIIKRLEWINRMQSRGFSDEEIVKYMTTPILTDTSPMPFGKHKGVLMQDVPTSYLHWLYTNHEPGYGLSDECQAVINYIEVSMDALKMEKPDLIWEPKRTATLPGTKPASETSA